MSSTKQLQVLVCGGGNSAHVLAALVASQPNHFRCVVLTMFGHEAQEWNQVLGDRREITIETEEGELTHGRPCLITDKPELSLPESDIIIFHRSIPSSYHHLYLEAVRDHLQTGRCVILGSMPCHCGFDWAVRSILGRKMQQVTLFGTVTLPWACRITHWGDRVLVLGTKLNLDMIVLPSEKRKEVLEQIQQIIGPRPLLHDSGTVSFLSLSLLNFWHPTIVYSKFRDTWDGNTPLSEVPLFYQGITDEDAELLLQISDEVQHLRTVLETRYPTLNLDYVRPSQEWFLNSYDDTIGDKSSFGAMIRSNKAYNGLRHPMKDVNGLFKPDFDHRYLTEDIPNGMLAIRGIAELAKVPTPTMDQVINWCQRMCEKEYLVDGKLVGKDVCRSRCPQAFHFRSLNDLITQNSYV